MAPNILKYDDFEDVIAAFVWRDQIHDEMVSGVVFPPDVASLLEEADAHILTNREQIVHRFPDVFEERAPREYWWWHLEKGYPNREVVLPIKRQDAA